MDGFGYQTIRPYSPSKPNKSGVNTGTAIKLGLLGAATYGVDRFVKSGDPKQYIKDYKNNLRILNGFIDNIPKKLQNSYTFIREKIADRLFGKSEFYQTKIQKYLNNFNVEDFISKNKGKISDWLKQDKSINKFAKKSLEFIGKHGKRIATWAMNLPGPVKVAGLIIGGLILKNHIYNSGKVDGQHRVLSAFAQSEQALQQYGE